MAGGGVVLIGLQPVSYTHLDVYKRQFLMIGLMLPFFFLAMYERDGLPLEKVLKNIIRTRFLYPRVRPYKTENFYALLSARKEAQPIRCV